MSVIPLNDQSLLAILKIYDALKSSGDTSYDNQFEALEQTWNDLIMMMKLAYDPELSTYLDAVNTQIDYTRSLHGKRSGAATPSEIKEINNDIASLKRNYEHAHDALKRRLKP